MSKRNQGVAAGPAQKGKASSANPLGRLGSSGYFKVLPRRDTPSTSKAPSDKKPD